MWVRKLQMLTEKSCVFDFRKPADGGQCGEPLHTSLPQTPARDFALSDLAHGAIDVV